MSQKFTFLSMILALAIGIVVALLHLHDQINWKFYYSSAGTFGDRCSYAVADWPGSFEAAKSIPNKLTPFPMPHRGKKNPPRAYEGQYLYTQCQVENVPAAWGYLGMGRVYGDSRLYLNGFEILKIPHGMDVKFPLPVPFQGKPLTISIISRGTAKGNVGLGALFPPFYTTEWSQVRTINRYLASIYSEQTMLRLGLALSFVFLLGMIWFFGQRYEDIGWVICFAAMLAFLNLLRFSGQFQFDFYHFSRRIFSSAYFLSIFFEIMFVLSFLRIKSFRQQGAKVFTPIFLTLAATAVAVPQTMFFKFRMLVLLPAAVGALCMFSLAFYLFKEITKDKARHPLMEKRIKMMLLLTSLTGLVLGAQAILDDRYGIYVDSSVQLSLLLFVGFIAIRDLLTRERQLLEEQESRRKLEESYWAATTIAGTVRFLAHDMKKPLQQISNLVRLDSVDASGTSRAGLSESLEHIDEMISDLLAVSPDDFVDVESTSLQKTALQAFSQAGLNDVTGVSLSLELATDNVEANGKILRRVLQNLFLNAAEATKSSCNIEVTSRNAADHVEIEVANSGSRIPDELLDKIFEANTTYGKLKGTGLGLTFCKLSLEKMRGSISAESESNRTIFRIKLPTSKISPAKSEKFLTAKLPKRICVVDDDVFVRDMWEHCQEFEHVDLFASSDQFIEQIVKGDLDLNAYDCIVLDYFFENSFRNGDDLAASIRERNFKGLLILASQASQGKNKIEGVDAVLAKGPTPLLRQFS